MSNYTEISDSLKHKKKLLSEIDKHINLKMRLVKQLDKKLKDISGHVQNIMNDSQAVSKEFEDIITLDDALNEQIEEKIEPKSPSPELTVNFYSKPVKKRKLYIDDMKEEAEYFKNWVACRGMANDYSPQQRKRRLETCSTATKMVKKPTEHADDVE